MQKRDKFMNRLSFRILRWALLTVAIALIIWSFIAGGAEDVLTKAANICSECIGLG